MLNRTRYNRLAHLFKALTNYLTLHPEFGSWPLTKVLEHLSLHELPAISQQLEPEQPRKRKSHRSNAASSVAKARKETELWQKEKEKTKTNNPLSPHPLPKEKENNKEKEFPPSPHAHEGEVRKTELEQANSGNNFEVWSEEDFKQRIQTLATRYPTRLLATFFNYWADRTSDGQMRFQLQETFDVEKRLAVWASKESRFCKPTHENAAANQAPEMCSQFALHQGRLTEQCGNSPKPAPAHDAATETTFDCARNATPGTAGTAFEKPERGTGFVRGEQSLPPL